MAVRDRRLTLPQIAEKLNATAVVEGSVLPGKDTATLTVQLIDAGTDTHIWSDRVQLSVGRLFEQQRSVAAEIARQLTTADARPAARPTGDSVDPEALNCYLLGRFHWYKLDPMHFPIALGHFEQAIAIEPKFSAAYAGIADVWGAMGYWGATSAVEVRDKIREAVEKALELDPMGAEAHMLAGAYEFHVVHDWLAARSNLEQAIEYNPSLSHARLLLALFLGTLGEPEARAQLAKARQLDPLNASIWMASAMHAAFERRTDEAKQYLERTFELDPAFPPAHELRADLAWQSGAGDAVVLERGLWQTDEPVSLALSAATGADDRDKLAAAAQVLDARSNETYVSPRIIARLYSLAAATDKAIDVLFRAIGAEDLMQPDLVTMMPAFEPVRRHPRFGQLREALGLPPLRS
ncbi:MAG: hypothetical protein AAFX10_12310 [Pseudomonadota bacterium]